MAADAPNAVTDEPWLTVIGIGDSGLDSLSSEALDALHAAETIFGGERHLAMLKGFSARLLPWSSPLSAGIAELTARAGTPTAVLATGNPMWFGVGATLARQLPGEAMRVLPAPSTFSLVAARLAWPLQECACLTVHGRPVERLIRAFHDGARLLVYSENGESPHEIAWLLTSRGFGRSRISVFEHVGGTKERVRTTTAVDFDLADIADLNTVAIDCVAGRAADPRPFVPGLPDDAFNHDGKMTKHTLRMMAIAALDPLPGRYLWDVGAGCGSVAIEWLRCVPGATATAIEPREDRLAMIADNANALGVPDLEIVEGRAPDVCADLDAPDAVFIGGGLSDGVFDAAWAALRPGGALVAHAVTLESEAILIDLHARHGGELVRVALERAEAVGPFRGFKPAMPVIHWAVRKPGTNAAGKPPADA